MSTKFYTKPFSETVGQQIVPTENTEIFALDEESIIKFFQDQGVILFRGFETNIDIFKQFTNKFSEYKPTSYPSYHKRKSSEYQ